MEKLITKIISESLRNDVYSYEIGFENLELKEMISNSGNIEMTDLTMLESIKNQLLIDCSVVLFNHLKSEFPDIAKKYEL